MLLGFDVAMNNQIPMRKFQPRAQIFKKQLQFVDASDSLCVTANRGHRCADNVVHDEVGQTIVGRARIEQPRDIWVIEPGQDWAFRSETAQDLSRCPAPRFSILIRELVFSN